MLHSICHNMSVSNVCRAEDRGLKSVQPWENANLISQLLDAKKFSLINGHDLTAKHMS